MLDFSFYLSLHFTIFFLPFLSMHSYNFDSMTVNLRDSANGTFVTSDDSSQLTTSALSYCISLLLPIFLVDGCFILQFSLVAFYLRSVWAASFYFNFWYPVAGGLCRRLRALMDYVATVSLKYKRAPDSHRGVRGGMAMAAPPCCA